MKPAIGSLWRHVDPGGCITVWRVHSHCVSKERELDADDADMDMTLLYTSGSGKNSIPVGDTTFYWSESMMNPDDDVWVPIDEEDLPLILLGAL